MFEYFTSLRAYEALVPWLVVTDFKKTLLSAIFYAAATRLT